MRHLEGVCREESARWFRAAQAADAAPMLKESGGQLPEPFAGWGAGDQPEVLVVGQNPGCDPDELLPDTSWNEIDYHTRY